MSNVSNAIGTHQNYDIHHTAPQIDETKLQENQDKVYEFLEEKLLLGLAVQKAIIPDKG